jgi:hypothetical protein
MFARRMYIKPLPTAALSAFGRRIFGVPVVDSAAVASAVAPSSILRTGFDSTRASNRIGWKDHADVQEFGDNKLLDASQVDIEFWRVNAIELPEAVGFKRAAELSFEGKPQKKRKMNPLVPAPATPAIEQPEATAPVDDDFEKLPPDVLEDLFAEAVELEEQVRINSHDAELAEQVPSLSGSKHAAEWSPKGMPLLKKRKTNPPEDAPAPVQVVGEPNIADVNAFAEEPQFDAGEFLGEEDDDSSDDEVQATRPSSNRGSRMLRVCLIWHYQLLLIKRYLTNTFPSNNSN